MADTDTLTAPPASTQAAPDVSTAIPPGSPSPPGDWRTGLPDDLKLDQTLGRFKDVGSLAKSYVELRKTVGDGEMVRVPKPDAKPEELSAFHRKLGVPDTADKYDVTLPELPEGLTWQTDAMAGFRDTAHKAGLTPAQVQALVGWYATNQIQTRDVGTAAEARAEQAQAQQLQGKLEKLWGPKDGPVWKRNVDIARRAVRTFFDGDAELAEMAEARGKNAAFVIGLARLGEQNLEHIYVDGEAPGEVDKESLSRQIDETRKEMMQVNAGSRRYGELKAHLDGLYQRRFVGGK